MSRVAYNRPLSQVGFRPFRKTTPFEAARGLGFIGDDSSTLASYGFSLQQISQIISAYNNGALSPAGYSVLVQGQISPNDLPSFLEQDPGASSSANSAGSAAGVPAGSVVTYQGSWSTTTTKNAADILNQVIAALPNDGLAVVSSSSSAGMLANTKILGIAEAMQIFTVMISVQPTGSYASPADIASIINHEYYVATGAMPGGSSAAVTSSAPGGTAASLTSSPVQWLEQNAMWVLLGIAAITIGPSLVKKL